MTYKVGDKVRLLGTKSGRKGDVWKEWFGLKGRTKNTIEKITSIRSIYGRKEYFLNGKSGFLIEKDFERVNISWKERMEGEE